MKTIIAEKPSVAREIARVLGVLDKQEGYFSGNGYFVTWALGHLVGLAMPEDYGISGFDKNSLPILPHPFLLSVRKLKKEKTYQEDAAVRKQLEIIGKLFQRSECIIVATDAGREGELIFRYVYEYLHCQKPFERLWISSLTEKAIKQGLENLKPGNEFTGLYLSAKARSQADWLVGINATQALSIAYGSGLYSLGRVQTPTLALICKRYGENKSFKSQKYWQIECSHHHQYISFKSLSVQKWEDQKTAENILKAMARSASPLNVISAEVQKITESPPLLFDLTGLQKEANKKLNFSAAETLDIAQSLYEKKFITYPRTGSRYIPQDIWEEIPDLIRTLQEHETYKEAVGKMKWGHFNKHVVNDLGVTDHHGLLITGKIPSALSTKENAVYSMIAFRLLEAVSESCVKEVREVGMQILHYDFLARGGQVIEPGWRHIKGEFNDDDASIIQDLPELKKGDKLKIKDSCILEKTTRPPALYTDAGILSAMENAGKDITCKEERQALQNLGIGTPATRAAVIELLLSRHYIKREKKQLIPTEKGLQVYEFVKEMKIADVSMTAQWELSLQKIESGETGAETFQKEMEAYVSSMTRELLQTPVMKPYLPELICPKCKKWHLIFQDRLVRCPNEKCNWVQFRRVCGVEIGISDLETLINNGRTSLISGMKNRAGKMFDAYIALNEKAESIFEFPKNSGFKKDK